MAKRAKPDYGSYIRLGERRLTLRKHPTDFSVIGSTSAVESSRCKARNPLSTNMVRLAAAAPAERDGLMEEARGDSIAHHVYQVAETNEEIIVDNHIFLELRTGDPSELDAIVQENHLVPAGRMGNAHVLRVTEATGRNPLKTANEIAERETVESCAPQLLVEMQYHQPALFPEQWYLTDDLINSSEVLAGSGIRAPEAWQITTGSQEIVLAVVDDGFDLGHPALRNVRIHPEARDFEGNDADPAAGADDFHGTPVSSIAVGSHDPESSMRGVAPGCTFLPVRIGFGPFARPIDILDVFRFVSARADVVNCSFGTPPRSFSVFDRNFRSEITRLTETGGRRGKGLVMVFSAANDDAPTFLPAASNINGVKFVNTGAGTIQEIPAGLSVFSGYPMTEGVVVVSAMSSRKRKAGYSCWGPHITVTAPSNNMHYVTSFVAPGSDPRRNLFIANYRGLGQVAASNRPGHGSSFSPISRFDNPATPGFREDFYTRNFGGTSGAAPVVTGVAALILSANPDLTAAQVRQILMATADQDLDPALDLANDPNVQGLTGEFVNGVSRWFGAGKVNAAEAVARARALAGGGPPPQPSHVRVEARPGLAIPDNRPQGVVSSLDVDANGVLRSITVSVDISHTFRGDLRVRLITPQNLVVDLQRFEGGGANDLKRSFSAADTPGLANLEGAGIDIRGRWSLHVSDEVRRDVGTLNAWSLDLGI